MKPFYGNRVSRTFHRANSVGKNKKWVRTEPDGNPSQQTKSGQQQTHCENSKSNPSRKWIRKESDTRTEEKTKHVEETQTSKLKESRHYNDEVSTSSPERQMFFRRGENKIMREESFPDSKGSRFSSDFSKAGFHTERLASPSYFASPDQKRIQEFSSSRRVKRVKLTTVEDNKNQANEPPASETIGRRDHDVKLVKNDTNGHNKSETPNLLHEKSTPTTAIPQLTSSAYREVSCMPVNRNKLSRNMKLVRIPQNESTPLCPNGLHCTLSTCTKRHDVPVEASKPNCKFFEKNGMCLKGSDCPFRHVKVNKNSGICRNFQLYGYCEKNNCALKHVRDISKGSRHNESKKRKFSYVKK